MMEEQPYPRILFTLWSRWLPVVEAVSEKGFYICQVGKRGADMKYTDWTNATPHTMHSFPPHKMLLQATPRFFKLSSWTRELEVICTDGAQEIERSSRYDLKLSWLKLSKPTGKQTNKQNKPSRTGNSEQMSQTNNKIHQYMKTLCVGRDKR